MEIKITDQLKKNKFSVGIFFLILAVGIFLRTYHFREWLFFYPDQARDVMIAKNVLAGKEAWPLLGPIAASTAFKVGPMYYYFQIIAGHIFGAAPEKVAYPDLFFSILSIPLFLFFFRRYFSVNLSLVLTGLYAVSFYSIKFARFAWNPNPLPFFTLLFLFSLLEFIKSKEKTHWGWIISVGIALGVGVQLHTITLLLMPATLFFVFVYLMKKSWQTLPMWGVIFLLAVILNLGQISSELKTNFYNTRSFFVLSTGASEDTNQSFGHHLELDTLCHAQANTYMLSSLGDKVVCNFLPIIKKSNLKKHGLPNYPDIVALVGVILSGIFSIFGYWTLGYYYKKEKDLEKKHFLGLISLFAFLSFLIMFPIINDAPLRYYIHLIFMPFLFLGFLLKFLMEKSSRGFLTMAILLVTFFVGTNFFTLFGEAKVHAARTRSDDMYIVLGEIESMADYIVANSPQKQAYFFAEGKFMQNYFKPLFYILEQKKFNLLRATDLDRKVPSGATVFYVWKNSSNIGDGIVGGNYEVASYQNFGFIGIYKLKKIELPKNE